MNRTVVHLLIGIVTTCLLVISFPHIAAASALADALDTTRDVTTGGDLPWFSQGVTTFAGSTAAQGGAIGDGQVSWMETTVNGPETVSFRWKVSSEEDYDFLRFTVDGDTTNAVAISGKVDWTEVRITLEAGRHTLRWEYTKDQDFSEGSDTGWVDQLVLGSETTVTLAVAPRTIAVVPGTSGTGATVTSTVWGGFSHPVSLTVSALPAGVTATITPATIPAPGAGSALLTVAATQDALPGLYPVTVTATGGGVTRTAVLAVAIRNLADALDTTRVVTTGGDLPWISQGTTTSDGTDAAQAGEISNGQSSWLETSVDGPATVFFRWKVSSEQHFDLLRFLVDGVEEEAISGDVAWSEVSLPLTAGTHTLRWVYEKDDTYSEGSDTAWVDQFQVGTFTLTAVPAVTIAPGGTAITTVAASVSGGFDSPIGLAADNLPPGITALFSPAAIPAPGDGSSTLTFTAGTAVAAGEYPVTVTGAGGGVTRSVPVTVQVAPPLFKVTGLGTYPSFAAMYDALATGSTATALARNTDVTESLDLDRNIALTLLGGYDAAFTDGTGMTTINGTLTVRAGRLTIGRFAIR